MTGFDWIVVAIVLLLALLGARQGLIAGAFSLGGLVLGAAVGRRLAPVFLHGGNHSPYAPLISLGAAIAGALILQSVGAVIAVSLRGRVLRPPALQALDTAGGAVLGAVGGLVVVWVLGVVALQLPGRQALRKDVEQSVILRRLYARFSPRSLIRALARFDPLPAVGGPFARVDPPDAAIAGRAAVQAAGASVVKVVGTACGLGIEGSGWLARPGLVVTAAHVVAGEHDTVVEPASGGRLRATAVAFDPQNDVAVLRVSGLRARPLPLVDARPDAAVAILGFPQDGPYAITPARIGPTSFVVTTDAYGHVTGRTITTLRADVREGDSGAPAVGADGAVQTVIYASRVGASGGFGVPTSAVRKALASARGPVSTRGCAIG